MNIGITTNIDSKKKYWELIESLSERFSFIEINNKVTPIRLADIKPLNNLRKRKKLVFSIHSSTQDFLSRVNPVRLSETEKVKSELFLAKSIGAKNVVIHVPKSYSSEGNLSELERIIKLSNNYGVNLLIENSESYIPSNKQLKFMLDNGVGMCLDMGHLNISFRGNLKKQIDFVRKNRGLIKEVHCHWNNSKKDLHGALNKWSLSLISELHKNTDLVIEARTFEGAKKSMKLLRGVIQC